jgi:lysozyme
MIEQNEQFLQQLKRHEGCSLEAYLCPSGVLTIGYGHNCEARPVEGVRQVGDVIDRARAMALLVDDVVEAARGLDVAVPWWREMDEARQGVLLNMAFNMGVPRLMGFKKALGAMSIGDYARAGTEMLDSKWAVQVKWRSAELARQMVLGEWE